MTSRGNAVQKHNVQAITEAMVDEELPLVDLAIAGAEAELASLRQWRQYLVQVGRLSGLTIVEAEDG